MKILLRSLILFCLILWVGGVLFFPAVAAIAFRVLPGPEQAGLVVRNCLLTLHTEGMIAGVLLLILLAAATVTRSYGRKLATIGPICCTLAMLALTVFSQYRQGSGGKSAAAGLQSTACCERRAGRRCPGSRLVDGDLSREGDASPGKATVVLVALHFFASGQV
jgi:hypothetical protein